jgi:RNA polymerase sigma factor (sigma-70 family)
LEREATNSATSLVRNWDAEKDDKLLSCMAQGESEEKQQAFEAFYRRHREYLYATCYRVASRYQVGLFDHDDLFQSTMVKAFKNANTFNAAGITDRQQLEDKVDAWLGEIAENVAFDLVRRKPICVLLDPQLLEGDDDGEGAIYAQSRESATCDGINEIGLIREAIDTLSHAEQTVLWTVSQFYERRDHQRTPSKDLDELVERLGISRDNFRKIKERAKKKIRKYMENQKRKPEAK